MVSAQRVAVRRACWMTRSSALSPFSLEGHVSFRGKPAGGAIVRLDRMPRVPKGWRVVEHRSHVGSAAIRSDGDALYVEDRRVVVYRSPHQLTDGRVVAGLLRREVRNKPVLNAILVEYLIERPELIPLDWARDPPVYVFFWGTKYRAPDSVIRIPLLCYPKMGSRSEPSWVAGYGYYHPSITYDAHHVAALLET